MRPVSQRRSLKIHVVLMYDKSHNLTCLLCVCPFLFCVLFTQLSQRLHVEGQQKERAGDEEAGADPLPGPGAHEQTGRRQREGRPG